MPARSLAQIRSLCMRRGIVFPGSAAYGGLGSFWDYGPLGVEMLNNVKRAWWRNVVYEREDMEGLDSAIITSRKVWQRSGHEGTFSDPLVENRKTNRRHRLDHILDRQSNDVLESLVTILADCLGYTFGEGAALEHRISEGGIDCEVGIRNGARAYRKQLQEHWSNYLSRIEQEPKYAPFWRAQVLSDIQVMCLGIRPRVQSILNIAGVIDPDTREVGDWTAPRSFNLMFNTHVGPVEAAAGTEEELAARVYLRPETAQGIFMNFKHVQTSLRRKVPFGIAQIGKAFRNEITPGNFIFRTREFEQMEMEFFIKPPQFVREGEKTDDEWHAEWIEQRFNWWLSLGVAPERLRKRAQDASELAHYSKATTDIEYLFPGLGWGEIEGIANRTDYDLSAHSRNLPEEDRKRLKLEPNTDSVETLDYFDPELKQRYIPWVIEPAAGVTRALLTFLCEAYHEELVKDPPAAELDAIRAELPAVLKNAAKKQKEAEAEPDAAKRKHDPQAVAEFCEALQETAARLPESLLELDYLLSEHPGAANLEPVRKLKPRVNKLAEDCVRVVLKLHPDLAPVKLAVFPLKSNKAELVDIARRITAQFRPFFKVQYDDTAGIGRLYRRQDEIGTPFCVTVDFQTLEDNTVTVRERDTMQQQRMAIDDLKAYLFKHIHAGV
jgi:glycyl-tRNA synthetase